MKQHIALGNLDGMFKQTVVRVTEENMTFYRGQV